MPAGQTRIYVIMFAAAYQKRRLTKATLGAHETYQKRAQESKEPHSHSAPWAGGDGGDSNQATGRRGDHLTHRMRLLAQSGTEEGSEDVAVITCPSGSYRDGDACADCPAGTISTQVKFP
jgi:hypothetical protein